MACFELVQYVPMCVSWYDIYSHSRLLFPRKSRHNTAHKYIDKHCLETFAAAIDNDSICPTN